MTTKRKNYRTLLRDFAYQWQNDPLGFQTNNYRDFFRYYWSWFTEDMGVTCSDVQYAWNHPKKLEDPIAFMNMNNL